MAYLIKTHEKSGLQVCSNGSVFVPESRRYKEHWTCGSLCGKYRIVHHNGKSYSVHRMVAETFIENPNNYPTVDHIDRNPLNNDVVPLGLFFLFAVVVAVTLAGGERKRNEFPAVLESLYFGVFPDVADECSSVQVCHGVLLKVHQD